MTMKPIKIAPENAPAIEAALSAVNGKASAHTFTDAVQILNLAEEAEKQLDALGLPKADRPGATFHAVSGSILPNAYAFRARATCVGLLRRGPGWYLATASEATIFPGARGRTRWLELTQAQDAKAVEVLRRGYVVQQPPAAEDPYAAGRVAPTDHKRIDGGPGLMGRGL